MLWEMGVLQYGTLMELHSQEPVKAESLAESFEDGGMKNAEEYAKHVEEYFVTQGKLRGIAYCIAKMLNPGAPNVDHVKQQIKEQWKAEQDDEEE
jgi:hypothetical protein